MKIEKPIRLIGIALPQKTSNQNNQSNIDCGQLWQKFEAGSYFSKISDKTAHIVYAVYHSYEGDHTSPFAYFIGCPVQEDAEVGEGLSELFIPPGTYHKELAKGPMPACIGQAWQKIWQSDIKRAYHTDFEIYDDRSADWNNAQVDIYLSVH
jgi:predicted transcriptional regulator YdeE